MTELAEQTERLENLVSGIREGLRLSHQVREEHMRDVERYVLEERGAVEVDASGEPKASQRPGGAVARQATGGRMKAFFLRDESQVELPEL